MNRRARQLATLSVKNLRAHTWLYSKLSLAFAVLVFLLCLFSAYALALNGMQSNILAEHAAANQIVSSEPISDLPNGTESFVAKRFDAFISQDEEDDEEGESDGGGEEYLPIAVTVSVNGVEYTLDNASFFDFDRVFASDKLLTENDCKELVRTRGSDDVLTGRMPEAANEAVVSEEYLDAFNLTGEQVLGKNLSMLVSRGEKTIVISDLVVCGILKREFHKLSGHDSYYVFSPYLLLSQANPIFADSERVTDLYVYSLPYWLSEAQIESITESYDCFFVGHGWLDDMVRLSVMQSIAVKLFVVVGGALGCSVALMIFLMMDKLIAVFSRDCGILLSCGMQFKHVKQLLLIMLAWVCLFAVVVASILTFAGVLGINAAIYYYFYMEITLSYTTVLALFGIGIAAVSVVAFAYYLYAVSKTKRRSIKEFLNTSLG